LSSNKVAYVRSCPRIVSQDVVAADILEMAFCETAWKAALKAWDSKPGRYRLFTSPYIRALIHVPVVEIILA
jgi:hypothetical protein